MSAREGDAQQVKCGRMSLFFDYNSQRRETDCVMRNFTTGQLVLLGTFDTALCNCLKMYVLPSWAGIEGM